MGVIKVLKINHLKITQNRCNTLIINVLLHLQKVLLSKTTNQVLVIFKGFLGKHINLNYNFTLSFNKGISLP